MQEKNQHQSGDTLTHTQQLKLEQIRQALRIAREENSEKSAVERPNSALPPLKKRGTPSQQRVANAAAETVIQPKPTRVQTLEIGSGQTTRLETSEVTPQIRSLPPLKKKDLPLVNSTSSPATVTKVALATATQYGNDVDDDDIEEADEKESTPKKAKKSKKEKRAKPKKTPKKHLHPLAIVGITLACLAVILGLAFYAEAMTFRGKFLPNTYVNGLNVYGLTRDEVEQQLLSTVTASNLTLTTANGKIVTLEANDFEAKFSLSDTALDEAISESPYSWLTKLWTQTEYTVSFDFSYSEEALRSLISETDFGSAVTEDAYIKQNENGTFSIVSETLGDSFDEDLLVNYIVDCLEVGTIIIAMENSGCYEAYRAEVVGSDLIEQCEFLNTFAVMTITYDYSDRKEVLEGLTIASWITLDGDGNPVIDKDAVTEFVQGMADKYDTYGCSRSFQSTLDGIITVPWTDESMYGWQINVTSTVTQLEELILTGETVTVEPIYNDWGYGYCRDTNDIGNTYIEVDISAQHVWYYVDGVVYIESDCVTGTETDADRRTPRGIFQIWSHESPRVLGTMAVQGYETLVNYWMPVTYTGVGLHDLSRTAWGGSIYLTNGSHGCINLPESFAKELYYSTENGIPVIIHD